MEGRGPGLGELLSQRMRISTSSLPGLPDSEITIAEKLKDLGYQTSMVGKWHLGVGKDHEYLPTKHGFDSYYVSLSTELNCIYQGGLHRGAGRRPPPPPPPTRCPPTLGYDTKGCLRVHYCLYSVTVHVYW